MRATNDKWKHKKSSYVKDEKIRNLTQNSTVVA